MLLEEEDGEFKSLQIVGVTVVYELVLKDKPCLLFDTYIFSANLPPTKSG